MPKNKIPEQPSIYDRQRKRLIHIQVSAGVMHCKAVPCEELCAALNEDRNQQKALFDRRLTLMLRPLMASACQGGIATIHIERRLSGALPGRVRPAR